MTNLLSTLHYITWYEWAVLIVLLLIVLGLLCASDDWKKGQENNYD